MTPNAVSSRRAVQPAAAPKIERFQGAAAGPEAPTSRGGRTASDTETGYDAEPVEDDSSAVMAPGQPGAAPTSNAEGGGVSPERRTEFTERLTEIGMEPDDVTFLLDNYSDADIEDALSYQEVDSSAAAGTNAPTSNAEGGSVSPERREEFTERLTAVGMAPEDIPTILDSYSDEHLEQVLVSAEGGAAAATAEPVAPSGPPAWNDEWKGRFEDAFDAAGVSDKSSRFLVNQFKESELDEATLTQALNELSTPQGQAAIKQLDEQIQEQLDDQLIPAPVPGQAGVMAAMIRRFGENSTFAGDSLLQRTVRRLPGGFGDSIRSHANVGTGMLEKGRRLRATLQTDLLRDASKNGMRGDQLDDLARTLRGENLRELRTRAGGLPTDRVSARAANMGRSLGKGASAYDELRATARGTSLLRHPIEKARLAVDAARVGPSALAMVDDAGKVARNFKGLKAGFAAEMGAIGGASGLGRSVAGAFKGKAGLVGVAVGAALEAPRVWSVYQQEGHFGKETSKATGRAVGSVAGGIGGWVVGAKVGGAAGAAIGTAIFPGVGTAIGAGAGAIIGGLAGSYVGSEVLGGIGDAVGGAVHGLASGIGGLFD